MPLANVNIFFLFFFVNLLYKLFSVCFVILSISSVLLQHFDLFYSTIKNE